MGTSSSLFNAAILQLDALNASTNIQRRLQAKLSSLLTKFGEDSQDIAIYNPNPFFGYHPDTNTNAQTRTLTLVDGGEDTQNIPLQPLLQPDRQVDVIFALDASADQGGWPDGTSMVATYQRYLDPSGVANGTGFPSVPGQNTFINLGLNQRPTFFGCNASNTTTPAPLIVYMPNAPYSYYSNVSTFQLQYNDTERNSIVQNGYNVATMGNGTLDSMWPICVGCAMISRSLARTGVAVPDACQTCFEKYCWNGTINNTTPAPYQPVLALQSSSQSSNARRALSITASSTMGVVLIVCLLIHIL
jgi:lysophospholipase